MFFPRQIFLTSTQTLLLQTICTSKNEKSSSLLKYRDLKAFLSWVNILVTLPALARVNEMNNTIWICLVHGITRRGIQVLRHTENFNVRVGLINTLNLSRTSYFHFDQYMETNGGQGGVE